MLHLLIGTSPWINTFVKSKIKSKNQLDKIYIKNGNKCNDYHDFKRQKR